MEAGIAATSKRYGGGAGQVHVTVSQHRLDDRLVVDLRAAAAALVGLIRVTVRLKPVIAAALKRASLKRQLAGEEIDTQQDLVDASNFRVPRPGLKCTRR